MSEPFFQDLCKQPSAGPNQKPWSWIGAAVNELAADPSLDLEDIAVDIKIVTQEKQDVAELLLRRLSKAEQIRVRFVLLRTLGMLHDQFDSYLASRVRSQGRHRRACQKSAGKQKHRKKHS